MISFRVFGENPILGFKCSGHSGLSESGSDVLCSAVTSAVRFAECAIADVLGLDTDTYVDPESATVELRLSTDNAGSAQTVFRALKLHMLALASEYPKNLTVISD